MITGKKKKKIFINIDREIIKLYVKQKGLCYYCNKMMHNPLKNYFLDGKHYHNTPTIEHLYPKNDLRRHCINGGSAKVVACAQCNHKKGSIDGVISYNTYGRKIMKKYKGMLINLLKQENKILNYD